MAAPPPVPRRGERPHFPGRTSFSPTSPSEPPAVQPPTSYAPDLTQGQNFGSCLQSSYEAISKRHEEELHALESLRGHIFKRQRIDKEYADNLARINQQCERSAHFAPSTTSPVVQAWKVFLQMSERLQSQLNTSAEHIKTMVEVVDRLIKNKRGAKAVCDDERVRLDTEFQGLCKEVQDLRRDYRKHLRATEKCKNQVQGLIHKQAKPNEIDRSRNKFVSAAKKLHQCHNDYTLAIINVNIHQDFYRQTLLPFSLDTLQQRMELQISEWKDVLQQYSQCLDMTQIYNEGFNAFYEALGQIDRESEYVQFISDNAREMPSIDRFEFDDSLLQAPCAPNNVAAGNVVVDNLTHQNITEKIQKLETDIQQHEQEIMQKRQAIEELEASPDDADSSKPDPKNVPKHVKIADNKGKVYQLESKKTTKEHQLILMQEAIQRLGPSPPPLFDPLGEGVDESSLSVSTTVTDGPASTTKKKKAAETMKRLKNVFKGSGGNRKSTTSSVPDDMGPDGDEEDHEVMADIHDEDEYAEAAEVSVEDEDWFFGTIDRKEAEMKCRQAGEYLVRFSVKQNKYVLTVHWNSNGRHFVIQEVPDPQNPSSVVLYRFEDKAFSTIHDLLDYHVNSCIPVTRASGAIISKPISRIDKWAIKRDQIRLGRKLGRGAFGEVCEATLLSTNEKVAVKTCRDTIPDAEKRKFLQEAEILKQYNHPNIVQLIGVCAEKDPVYIIMEILPGGALLDFLRKKGTHQSCKKLTQMCTDACAGMAYLESMNCIHRDLAARNCLVGESDIVKISDFGMSREEECGIYQVSSGSRHIPIKWTAPEALNLGRYTSASDVWSFGILLWEVFSLGATPYPGMSNNEAREQVEMGYRLPPPSNCPEEVYDVMQKCWQYEEDDRPQFASILQLLQQAQSTIH